MNAPGKELLKVSSILLIIFGAVATVIPIIGLIGSAKEISLLGGLKGIIIVTIILILAVSVLELIVGIVGLKNYGDPTKGGFFITTGIILCALSLVSLVLSNMDGSFNITILGIPTEALRLIAFVLPVLYIIGGSMNKKVIPPVL